MAGLAVVLGLIYGFGWTFSAVAAGLSRLQGCEACITVNRANSRFYALTAGDEANICVKLQATDAKTVPETVTGNFVIVNYSEKALAVFGDTKAVKDELKALDGRFNPKLTHEGTKKAGWIFSKSKEQELNNLLTIKRLQ